MEKTFKSGFVTIIGRPNVGKSTLLNHLMGQKIAIMSNKPQTTRNQIRAFATSEKGQIIFIDTPGIHEAKHKLGDYMNASAERTFNEVDLLLWIIEPDKKVGKGDQYIIEQLQRVTTPVILIINKIDLIKKEEILEVIATYKDVYDFAEIIPVSAINGENTEDLMDIIFKYFEEGPMYFPEDMITDQPERQIIAELIREKALKTLDQEVPHGIAVVIDAMQLRNNGKLYDIDATIICEKDSHKGIIIGKQGTKLKDIGTRARKDIEALLGIRVNLKLWVKIKKNWRDSEFLMKNFGYDKRNI